ncbi:MAG: alpha-L-fucosidase [Acidobacteria bacterium]|nr:alpha-L-fucosidase [Acidobacteriota bacterium]
MGRRIAAFLLLAAACAAQPADPRLAWYSHDKFGMFIHWGPYSLLAGEYKGQRTPIGDEAEWIMQRFNIPVKEYREMARGLRPLKFDAAEYVRLAKAAGMKYIVITAKHHDGFAMYRSKVSSYNIADWTGWGRDPVDELSKECRKAGIRFCVYYSHREDWDDPDGYGNNWDYDRAGKNFARYLENKSKPQLRELLTNYGPLGLVWFDRGMETDQQASEFVQIVRTLQPACLVNGRVGNYGHELMGDYQNMGDNGMPTGGLDEYWETPQTLNTTWGYSKFDQEWKTPAGVIHRLVEIVSKGGNYLLNIGPMADGVIPPPSVAVLKKVGAWIETNGESIYGTSACPAEFTWGRCTVKGEKVYLHVFNWPADGILRVSGFNNRTRAAYAVNNPSRKLQVGRDNDVITIAAPVTGRDEIDTVVALEIEGRLSVRPSLVTQGSDVPIELDYMRAQTTGKAAKRFNRDGKFHISKWTGPADSAAWRIRVSQAGPYRVRVRYAARPTWAGSEYRVKVGGQLLTARVAATGEWYAYKTFDVGSIDIAKAGEYEVSIRPVADSDHDLMYFQSLILEPAGVKMMVE